jgi:hypothetical protein
VNPQGGAGTQRACGSAAPTGTALQVPARPVTLQAWQVPHADIPQQTPSTQKLPVRHSSLELHACPRRFLSPQRLVDMSQMLPAAHWLSAVQVVLQAVPVHA